MIQKIAQTPQMIFLVLGGWIFLFGLTGVLTYSDSSTEAASDSTIQVQGTQTQSRIKVVPANQRPGAVGNELQGAQGIQRQGGDGLQQQNQNDLQPNSGLSEFPDTSNPLQ